MTGVRFIRSAKTPESRALRLALAPRVLVTLHTEDGRRGHDALTRDAVARRLAVLQGCDYAGEYSADEHYAGALYFVPGDTLVGARRVRALGIRDERDLFGGVVPHAFVATKTITHPLIASDATAPTGWSTAFGRRVRGEVLEGFSAFSLPDAQRAGLRLLDAGRVRIKRARGTGGRGQTVVADAHELEAALAGIDLQELASHGVVLEQELDQVTTYSVGQVRTSAVIASYWGMQRATRGNDGAWVYGGSDLVVARGGFEDLLQLDMPPDARHAIVQARAYDAAAAECFPRFFASRRNYDVAQGVDGQGRSRSGVLEQSWRAGGATSAEIAALEAFVVDPALSVVRASCCEIYGPGARVPSSATVYFSGEDERTGMITKYAWAEPYADA